MEARIKEYIDNCNINPEDYNIKDLAVGFILGLHPSECSEMDPYDLGDDGMYDEIYNLIVGIVR